MQNERKRILKMLARGEITVDEADKLLAAAGPGTAPARRKPRYLFIIIEKANETKDRVNLRIPIKLLAHGLKLTKLIPAAAREKVNTALARVGMNFTITEENIVDFIDALTDISVEIDGGEKVQIYCR
ncbi:MAG: hypothetical protein QGH60_00690 [Phycisphaerae bacterium]|jgi:hypothetical protein|nr:hypothetical protein [Phycisphaerae bacterium]